MDTSILAWPVAVVVISLLFMLIFRKPLTDFIGRINKLGIGNKTVSANPTTIQKQKTELNENESKDTIDVVFEIFSKETMTIIEERIKDVTKIDNLSSPNEKVTKLFRYSQALNLAATFDRVYNKIYNSQIKILDFLNSSTSRNKDDVKPFYEQAKANYPDWFKNYSFDAYLNYLVVNLMIVITPEHIVSITTV